MTLYRMNSTSPAGSEHPQILSPAGSEGGDSRLTLECPTAGVAALDPFVHRDMRWCEICEDFREFAEVLEDEAGRVGVCLGCGNERRARFSRTTEVA